VVDELREVEIESRLEATFVVALVIALQVALAVVSRFRHWRLWTLPWWVWLGAAAPELLLLVALAWEPPARKLQRLGHRRTASLALVGTISVANTLALIALIGSLLNAQEKSGTELLFKGVTIWGTNVIVFGLWFWEFDRGGPVRRREEVPPRPDFQFPQSENPQLADPAWQPYLIDYLYISFTNAIAFSPTDAMPLSRWAKLLMLSESAISAVTVLLVAARAVNILR
jgi:hypothetical protein